MIKDKIDLLDSEATKALKKLLWALQSLKHEYVRQHHALAERPPKGLPADVIEKGKDELMLRRAIIADLYNALREEMS